MVQYQQDDFPDITIGTLQVDAIAGSLAVDAVRDAITVAFLEDRRVVVKHDERTVLIDPREIVEVLVSRLGKPVRIGPEE